MVRPGRERLRGAVEVDEAYWGAPEEGAVGRLTEDKALIAVAVEEDRDGIGRIRLHRIPNLTRATLHDFIAQSIEPGSTVRTDGLPAYLDLAGYDHDRKVQRNQPKGEHLLPRAHRVISLFKRWLMGTHQGAVSHAPITAGASAEVLLSQVFKDREQVSRGVASRLSLSSSATSSRCWRMWR
jgi:transposase-like protein